MDKAKTKTETSTEESKFSLDVLRKNCVKLFKVSSSTFDGATNGLVGDFTVTEIKNKIKGWCEQPIKKGGNK